jgi:allantoin racemase
MKIIAKLTKYPPEEGRILETELLRKMKTRGQLENIQVDFDEGYDVNDLTKDRDEEFLARISRGTIIKVKEYCEKGIYDAIVNIGTMGMGFFASRMISRIPVVTAVFAGMHVASIIGERFTLIEATDAQALIARHNALLYGLNDKLASVRYVTHSSTDMHRLLRQYKKDERIKIPEVKEIVDDIAQQCVKAIEKDRIDTLIFGCTPLQCFEDEVRNELDRLGYSEVPIVCELASAIELAKAMVNLGITQAPRAYPSDALKAKPEFR